MNKSELLGLKLAARYAIQPNMMNLCGENNSQAILRRCLTKPESDPLITKQSLNSPGFPHLNTFLTAIATATRKDPFSEEVVASYWHGNKLTEKTFHRGRELIIAEYEKRLPPGFADSLSSRLPQNIHLTHLSQVAYIAAAGYPEPESLNIINQCMIAAGRVLGINTDHKSAFVSREIIRKDHHTGFYIARTEQTVKLDPDLTPDLKTGDRVALHLGYVAEKLAPDEAADLSKWTKIVVTEI